MSGDTDLDGGVLRNARLVHLKNNAVDLVLEPQDAPCILAMSNNLCFLNPARELVQITDGAALISPFPIGSIMLYAGTLAPDGWYLCDGSEISRKSDEALFAVIGIVYGPGDKATTFNLPNLSGRAPIGSGTGPGLTNRNLGDTPGEEKHQLNQDELPGHDHVGRTTSGLPKFYMTVGALYNGHTGADTHANHQTGWPGGGQPQVPRNDATYSNADHQHDFRTTGTVRSNGNQLGAGVLANPFEIIPPSLVMNFIIRAR